MINKFINNKLNIYFSIFSFFISSNPTITIEIPSFYCTYLLAVSRPDYSILSIDYHDLYTFLHTDHILLFFLIISSSLVLSSCFHSSLKISYFVYDCSYAYLYFISFFIRTVAIFYYVLFIISHRQTDIFFLKKKQVS